MMLKDSEELVPALRSLDAYHSALGIKAPGSDIARK